MRASEEFGQASGSEWSLPQRALIDERQNRRSYILELYEMLAGIRR